MNTKIIPPTRLDIAPYKTIWEVANDDGSLSYYMQLSENQTMCWKRIGDVMELALAQDFIYDAEFQDAILWCYHVKEKAKQSHEH